MEVANLWEKISWWAKFWKNISKEKVKLTPWMEEGAPNLLAQIFLLNKPNVMYIGVCNWGEARCL
jgi:hypothetical protein